MRRKANTCSQLREESTAQKLKAFFEANPDEELTIRHIQEKFSVSEDTVYTALRNLNRLGVLEYVKVARLASKGRFAKETA